jgi:hypothetical protein
VKYGYYTLPFFSLLAASLAAKCLPMLKSASLEVKKHTRLAVVGLILLGVTVIGSMSYVHQFSVLDFVIFSVEPGKILGYSTNNYFPPSSSSPIMIIQYAGFIVILSGIFWASRNLLLNLLKTVSNKLKPILHSTRKSQN